MSSGRLPMTSRATRRQPRCAAAARRCASAARSRSQPGWSWLSSAPLSPLAMQRHSKDVCSPVAGAPVQVVERFEAGASGGQRLTTVRTGADGGFRLRLAPGPSRQIVAATAPTATQSGATSRELRISVHSGVHLRASAPVARIGGRPLIFSGRVRGEAMPAEGKTVELQFRLPNGTWSEFRTVRTNSRGRFRYPYRFADDDSRGIRFQFRAFVPAQAGWPFEPAGSLPVRVRGV